MLRASTLRRKVQSHQLYSPQHPHGSTRFGRFYNRGFIKYGFGGWGMSTYSVKKSRKMTVRELPSSRPRSNGEALSSVTRSLSPHWRSFALADGGVLMAHPSHAQIMTWNQQVLKQETQAMGMTSMDEWTNSRIQSIIADNTIENVSVSQWRKRHIWNLVKSHAHLQRRWGMSGFRQNIVQTVKEGTPP